VTITTPEWVQDAVFYQIFPDRFAASTRASKPSNLEAWDAPPTPFGFKGGDLLGVAEKLDYLRDLGITAIYLNPIFASTANPRYHTFDYYAVDPILGGNAALRELIDQAHARSIHIVLDGVFNHASRGFYQFNHTLENGAASPYLDWFYLNEEWLSRATSGRLPAQARQRRQSRALGLQGLVGFARAAQAEYGLARRARVPPPRQERQSPSVPGRRNLARCAALAARRPVRRGDELSIHPGGAELFHRRELVPKKHARRAVTGTLAPSARQNSRPRLTTCWDCMTRP